MRPIRLSIRASGVKAVCCQCPRAIGCGSNGSSSCGASGGAASNGSTSAHPPPQGMTEILRQARPYWPAQPHQAGRVRLPHDPRRRGGVWSAPTCGANIRLPTPSRQSRTRPPARSTRRYMGSSQFEIRSDALPVSWWVEWSDVIRPIASTAIDVRCRCSAVINATRATSRRRTTIVVTEPKQSCARPRRCRRAPMSAPEWTIRRETDGTRQPESVHR